MKDWVKLSYLVHDYGLACVMDYAKTHWSDTARFCIGGGTGDRDYRPNTRVDSEEADPMRFLYEPHEYAVCKNQAEEFKRGRIRNGV